MFNLTKIRSAYKNLDTISFIRLLKDQDTLLEDGYSKLVIKEKKDNIEDFEYSDMNILGYKPYPNIPAKITILFLLGLI